MEIRIAGIIKESIVDGPGIRLVVFTQGCKHHCPGCHNPHTHSFEGGSMIKADSILEMMSSNPLLDGITLSGGEPFEQAEALSYLAGAARERGYHVMTYSGYIFEHLIKNRETIPGWNQLLQNSDVLVDGRFEIARKNLLLKFRGSENQRIIDVQKSLIENKIIELEL